MLSWPAEMSQRCYTNYQQSTCMGFFSSLHPRLTSDNPVFPIFSQAHNKSLQIPSSSQRMPGLKTIKLSPALLNAELRQMNRVPWTYTHQIFCDALCPTTKEYLWQSLAKYFLMTLEKYFNNIRELSVVFS